MRLSKIMATLMFLSIAGMVVSIPGVYASPYSFPTHSIKAGDIISFQDGYGYGNGGEFKVYDDKGAFLYYSFCVETDEYISFGTGFKVASITKEATQGGSGGPSPDPIDPKTAYLYYSFSMGTLSGYDYGLTSQHEKDAQSLQIAIWFIEQELGSIDTEAGLLAYNPKAWQFYDAAKTAGWRDTGSVWVLTLVDRYTGEVKQDQLVLVPEPSTLLFLGTGLLGLGFWGIRRSRKGWISKKS